MTKRAFAVAAHPDDIEFTMMGTLLLLKEAGYETHYMNIANGSCGTATLSASEIILVRREEARKAAAMAGAIYHESLVNDLDIFYDKPLLAAVSATMREVAPEILLTQSPSDYMEDHQNAARLAAGAAFCRSIPNYPTTPPRPSVNQDVTVYHSQPHGNRDMFRQVVQPDLFVDISSAIARKRDILNCHQTQKAWLDETQGMDSYLDTMQSLAREVGALSGRSSLAEGWRRRSHLGYCRESADPLAEALAPYVCRRG